MFDLGWTELLLIGIVALIVVGPKDLPVMFRAIGRFTGKAKAMAREFSSAMNAAADDAGVNEISKTIKAAANPGKFGTDKLREASGWKPADKPKPAEGSETAKLSAEREEARRKVSEATARAATERKAREAAATDGNEGKKPHAPKGAEPSAVTPEAKPAPAKPATDAAPKKPAARKAAASKPAQGSAAAKPAARSSAAKPKSASKTAKSKGDA